LSSGEKETAKGGIMGWRGSIIVKKIQGIERKFLLTLHPSYVLRQYLPGHWCLKFDLTKAKVEQDWKGYEQRERNSVLPIDSENIVEVTREILRDNKLISVDIETNRATTMTSIGFAVEEDIGYSFILANSFYSDKFIGKEVALQCVKEILESSNPKVFHNGVNFDIPFLTMIGYKVNGLAWDTFCAAHQLDVELPRSLAFLTTRYTDHPYHKSMLKEGIDEKVMNYELLGEYNCLDVMLTLEIANKQMKKLGKEGIAWHKQFYIDLLPPLLEAEIDGIRVDLKKKEVLKYDFGRQRDELKLELLGLIPVGYEFASETKAKLAIEKKIKDYEESGKCHKKDGGLSTNYLKWVAKLEDEAYRTSFNPDSPLQVQEVLFKALKLPQRKKHKRITSDDNALNKILLAKTSNETGRQFAEVLLKYRGVAKLIDSYLNFDVSKDGRVRGNYKIGATKTGRLACDKWLDDTGLNLMTLPKRKGKGGLIRGMFLPDEGQVFVSADLCQAEARVVAWEAGEEGIKSQFREGKDPFKYIASLAYDTSLETVTDKQRDTSKKTYHSATYGVQKDTAALDAGITSLQADILLTKISAQFPRLQMWRDDIVDKVINKGRLETCLGRWREFYGRKELWRHDGQRWYREPNPEYMRDAWSWIPQSTIGDLLNLILIKVWKRLKELPTKTLLVMPKPRLRLQVHDQMVFTCQRDFAGRLSEIIIDEAQRTPIKVMGEEIVIPMDVEVLERMA